MTTLKWWCRPYMSKLSLLLVILIITLLTACVERSIAIDAKRVDVVRLSIKTYDELLESTPYLRIVFSAPEKFEEQVDDPLRLHIRVRVVKKGVSKFDTSASADFIQYSSDSVSDEHEYEAYFFKSLKAISQEAGKSISLDQIEYDALEVQVVYPVMVLGTRIESNIVKIPKSLVDEALAKPREDKHLTLE